MEKINFEEFELLFRELADGVKFGSLGGAVGDAATVKKLYLISDLLIEDAKKFNLTSIVEPAEIIRKHLIDSIIPLSLAADNYFEYLPKRLADVGTGAGFPLLPMAAVLAKASPESRLWGIDSTAKKISHIEASAKYAGLHNITAISGRAEEIVRTKNIKYRETFELVTARAVASLPILLELCAPLVSVNGIFAALKSHAEDEIPRGDAAANQLGMTNAGKIDYELPGGDQRCVIFYRKISETAKNFPRRYPEITKAPLA